MTRTIQNTISTPTTVSVKRAFLAHAADLYGLRLTVADLDALEDLDDVAAIATAFPQLSDAERDEALWALGNFSG